MDIRLSLRKDKVNKVCSYTKKILPFVIKLRLYIPVYICMNICVLEHYCHNFMHCTYNNSTYYSKIVTFNEIYVSYLFFLLNLTNIFIVHHSYFIVYYTTLVLYCTLHYFLLYCHHYSYFTLVLEYNNLRT